MVAKSKTVDPKVLEILVAPLSLAPLSYDAERQELISKQDGLAFPIRDGIPILLVDEARVIGDDSVPKGNKSAEPGDARPDKDPAGK